MIILELFNRIFIFWSDKKYFCNNVHKLKYEIEFRPYWIISESNIGEKHEFSPLQKIWEFFLRSNIDEKNVIFQYCKKIENFLWFAEKREFSLLLTRLSLWWINRRSHLRVTAQKNGFPNPPCFLGLERSNSECPTWSPYCLRHARGHRSSCR